MRRVGLRALLAGVMSIGLASAAWAGTVTNDRDDLLDVDNSMAADKLDSPMTTNGAFMDLSAFTAFASGSVRGPGASATTTSIEWSVFEPDQTKRSSSGGSMQQKDQVALRIIINGTQVFPVGLGLTPVPGCKAKVQVKAPKGSTGPSDVTDGNWSLNCNGKQANAALALSDQNLTDLQTALGKKVVGKGGNLNIKGKCTGTNCDL